MKPFTSDLNFTPSSTAFGSFTDGLAGVAVAFQPPQGQHRPRRSRERPRHVGRQGIAGDVLDPGVSVPPRKVAVKVSDAARGLVGTSVAVRVAAS